MGTATVTELKQSSSGRRTLTHSASTRRTSDWSLSDVSSDLTVEVGGTSFSLHKFPLVSRSGKICKILSDSKDSKITKINLQTVPGGEQAFELAVKFCYGVNIDISLSNVATMRCLAHYLQMTEEFGEKNLEYQAEIFLKEVVYTNIKNSLVILHQCETLLPIAEDINLVSRIIATIASNACKEQRATGLPKLESLSGKSFTMQSEMPPDWWGWTITILNLDFFQKVLVAMKSKGLKQETVSKILINYAQKSLHDLPVESNQITKRNSESDVAIHKKQRDNVEAIVGLLPVQSKRSPIPLNFLSGLLKSATTVCASTVCKGDLERRIGMQLDQAILEDILIPASPTHNTRQLYETDSVLRIFSVFLNLDEEDDCKSHFNEESDVAYEFETPRSPKQTLLLKVSRLMDSYLTEVALDANMMPSKFIHLSELLPDHARVIVDGLYRAIDIFLKVHPNIKESDRYRLCKTIDCQKLSHEACSHAAQNERLPVQMAVQVLYFEQIRLRNAMIGNNDQFFVGSTSGQFPQRSNSGMGSGAMSPRDNYASVRRENRELKLEVARMRMRLTDLEKDHVSMKQELVRSKPAKSVVGYFSRNLSKLNTLLRFKDRKSASSKSFAEPRFAFQKQRRYSIS